MPQAKKAPQRAPAPQRSDDDDDQDLGEAREKSTEPDEPPSEEAIQAQNIMSTRSGVVTAARVPEGERSEEAEASAEKAAEVANELTDLTREELVRLQSAVTTALNQKGQDLEQTGPSLMELSDTLPPVADDDTDAGGAADAVDIEDENTIVAWSVRQAQNQNGDGIGPKYIRVVTADGRKHVAEL